jgi:hypothetical protein
MPDSSGFEGLIFLAQALISKSSRQAAPYADILEYIMAARKDKVCTRAGIVAAFPEDLF